MCSRRWAAVGALSLSRTHGGKEDPAVGIVAAEAIEASAHFAHTRRELRHVAGAPARGEEIVAVN